MSALTGARGDVSPTQIVAPSLSLEPQETAQPAIGTFQAVTLAVAQIAMRLLFPLAVIAVFSVIVPVSMQAFILVPMGVSAVFVSAFFFIDEPFYPRSAEAPSPRQAPVLAQAQTQAKRAPTVKKRPEIKSAQLLRNVKKRNRFYKSVSYGSISEISSVEKPIESLPPKDIKNENGSDCWLCATMQLIMNSPDASEWLRNPPENPSDPNSNFRPLEEAFRTFIEGQDARVRSRPGEALSGSPSTKALRKAIAEINGRIQASGVNEDPFEAFDPIMERIPCFQISILERVLCGDQVDEEKGGVTKRIKRENPNEEGNWASKESNLSYLSLPITDDGNLSTMLGDYTIEIPQKGNCVSRPDENNTDARFPVMRKEIRVQKAPPVLVIQIKRSKEAGRKDRRVVQVPLEFDLPVYQEPPQCYRLKGVALHRGDNFIRGGHYMALIRREQGWHLCNDEYVDPVSLEYVKAVLATETRDRPEIPGPERARAPTLDPYMLWYEQV